VDVLIVSDPRRTSPLLSSEVKTTRKTSGKAKLRNARLGLRQNVLLTYRTCLMVKATVLIAAHPL
jgi:hypothetical protein